MTGGPVFECRQIMVGRFSGAPPSYFTLDESDALAWAQANLTRGHEQISIEVNSPGDVSTFAIRHVTHEGDSGWRCWRDGDFVGSMSIAALLGPDRVVA